MSRECFWRREDQFSRLAPLLPSDTRSYQRHRARTEARLPMDRRAGCHDQHKALYIVRPNGR
jgi:hypothetical protein